VRNWREGGGGAGRSSEPTMMASGAGWTRLAGASGALAVGLGAYGAHGMQGKAEKWRTAFEAANKYHLVHSAALLGVAATRRPAVSGGLFAAGLVLFSGSCYAAALAERKDFGRLAPIGGLCFIAGWLAMAV